MSPEANKTAYLELDEYLEVKALILDLAYKEVGRHQHVPERVEQILTFLASLNFSKPMFDWLTPASLESLTKDIFTNGTITSFVMNLAQNVALSTSPIESVAVEYAFPQSRLAATVIRGFTTIQSASELLHFKDNNLIPERFHQAITVDRRAIVEVLQCNYWLVVLICLYSELPGSAFFKDFKTPTPTLAKQ